MASAGDEPQAFRVTGLPPSSAAELDVTSTDAAGRAWSSQATFTADDHGTVDLATAASSGGTYLGVSAMGLIDRRAKS